ncbi:MAG: type IX secretion system membrane protein PorP/SprF [Cytophagaceae bacterium]
MGKLQAQTVELYPDMMLNYYNNLSHFNPSYFSYSNKWDGWIQYKSRLAPLNAVSTVSLTGARYFKVNNYVAQVVRLQIYNEREGSYIQRPRVWLDYAYRIQFSKEVYLSLGLGMGFVQFNINAPSSTATGSATAPDISTGTSFQYKNHQIGLGVLQLLNNQIQPINGRLWFKRYITCYAQGFFKVRFKDAIHYSILYRQQTPYFSDINIHSRYTLDEKVSIGATYKYKIGVAFMTQFSIPASFGKVHFAFSYMTPLGYQSSSLAQIMELGLGYQE